MSSESMRPSEPSDIAIRVMNLSKVYRIYDRPEDRLKQSIYPRFNKLLGRDTRKFGHEFWALRDVSLEVRKRETIGIIGRNGSGKSTLLQLICGTLHPAGGTVETHGRVAALLELGSGFHPEFTGRENVYMNATILGMTPEEVNAKFDAIEAFADIGDFIEQPVKTYSSGMTLRLAFAVIANVDADILVVDEALAVGDAIFTQKCMRFIHSFQKHGTLLFVSHDMGAVQNLCKSSIWLAQGQIKAMGASKNVVDAYVQDTFQTIYGEELTPLAPEQPAGGSGEAETIQPGLAMDYEASISVQDNLTEANGFKSGAAEVLTVKVDHRPDRPDAVFKGGEPVRMIIKAVAHQELPRPILGFLVKDRLGQDLFGENTLPFTATASTVVHAGQRFKAEFDFSLPMLPNGQYVVMASVADGTLKNHVQHHYLHDALVITVASSKVRWGLVGLPFDRVVLEVSNGR